MGIDFAAFLETLPIMLSGMLGIFSVIVIIYIVVLLIGRIGSNKKDQNTEGN